MLKHIFLVNCMGKYETDEKFRRTKVPKFRLGAEHVFRRKILSAEISKAEHCGANERNEPQVERVLLAGRLGCYFKPLGGIWGFNSRKVLKM